MAVYVSYCRGADVLIKVRHYVLIVFLVLMAAWTTLASAQDHKAGHDWGYDGAEGPSHWGNIKPEFALCKNGHRQSPINISNTQKTDLPLKFDYKLSPLQIIDNSHTIMINYAPGSSFRVGDKQYQLKQFHFHRPSEENIHGKHFDMVVHLVHADREGHVAVVAVLLEKGADNPLIHELWKHFPKKQNKVEVLDNVQIDLTSLLPVSRGYYTFSGSLTTPPCSENVTWFVLKHPVTVTAAEIEQFGKLYRHNARPTQPLYGRVVLESK